MARMLTPAEINGVTKFVAAGLPAEQARSKKSPPVAAISLGRQTKSSYPHGHRLEMCCSVTSREAYRLAYAAMVLALAVACTPAVEEPAPAAEVPPITPPADTATGPAIPNTADTLATPAPETAPPNQAAASPAATETPAPSAAAPPPAAAPPAAAPVAITPEELAAGRTAYARTCAMCHGAKGEGTPAAAAIVSRDPAVIANKVVKGPINPGDRMPAMSAMLSAAEIEAVAKFVAAGFPQ